jgi:hypothetical protein
MTSDLSQSQSFDVFPLGPFLEQITLLISPVFDQSDYFLELFGVGEGDDEQVEVKMMWMTLMIFHHFHPVIPYSCHRLLLTLVQQADVARL